MPATISAHARNSGYDSAKTGVIPVELSIGFAAPLEARLAAVECVTGCVGNSIRVVIANSAVSEIAWERTL
jgi:hypothetical protein